jgi:4,5-dihydroxyphthalate decarboxylase
VDLTLGLSITPRTRALFDGSVRPEGIELRCEMQFGTGLDNTGARHRAILQGKIDGGECSTSSLVLARIRGVGLRALPVFLARQFRHRCMFCAASSPLAHPSDLKGKRVTVHRYNSTTAVWIRGLLQNEYGLDPSAMEWNVAEADVGAETSRPAPRGVTVKFIAPPRTREHAIQMVEDGEIDAALEPYSGLASNHRLRRLLGDYRAKEAAYFHRTQVVPVIHTLVLREELVVTHPWAVGSLIAAFREARSLAQRYMNEEEKAEARWLNEAIDYDPFSYRLDTSARKSLEALLHYQVQQKLLESAPALEDVFFPGSLEI